jgi:hypothetical protein
MDQGAAQRGDDAGKNEDEDQAKERRAGACHDQRGSKAEEAENEKRMNEESPGSERALHGSIILMVKVEDKHPWGALLKSW